MKIERSAYLDDCFDYLFSIYIVFALAVIGRYVAIFWRSLRPAGRQADIADDAAPPDDALVSDLDCRHRAGDQVTVGGETFVIQDEPERRDPDRLVWTLDVRPAEGDAQERAWQTRRKVPPARMRFSSCPSWPARVGRSGHDLRGTAVS